MTIKQSLLQSINKSFTSDNVTTDNNSQLFVMNLFEELNLESVDSLTNVTIWKKDVVKDEEYALSTSRTNILNAYKTTDWILNTVGDKVGNMSENEIIDEFIKKLYFVKTIPFTLQGNEDTLTFGSPTILEEMEDYLNMYLQENVLEDGEEIYYKYGAYGLSNNLLKAWFENSPYYLDDIDIVADLKSKGINSAGFFIFVLPIFVYFIDIKGKDGKYYTLILVSRVLD